MFQRGKFCDILLLLYLWLTWYFLRTLPSSLKVVLLNSGQRDLVGLQDSTLMEGSLEGLVAPTTIFELTSYNVTTPPRKPPLVESKMPCTLEELYTGSARKMKISRTLVIYLGIGNIIHRCDRVEERN